MTEQSIANHLEESNNRETVNKTVENCGGPGFCEHGRVRSQCKDCGGSGICEHGQRRSQCKDCGGPGICEHGRVRSQCKDCGGPGFCEHGRQRSQCKYCIYFRTCHVCISETRKDEMEIEEKELYSRNANIIIERELLEEEDIKSNLVLVGTKMLLFFL